MLHNSSKFCGLRHGCRVAALALILGSLTPNTYAAFESYGAGGMGSFSVSCSGPGDGGLANPNFDNRLFFKAGAVCNTSVNTGGATTATSTNSSFSSSAVAASGDAQSGNKIIKLFATMSTDQQSVVRFPAGFAEAGWTDTLTVNSLGNEGQLAIVNVLLNVDGSLSANGPNVFARLSGFISSETGSATQPGFQVQAGVNPSPAVINESIIVPLRFVIGTAGEFIVKMQALAMTSSQTSLGNNTSTADFFNTISWGGITSVTFNNGDAIPDFNLLSASGEDWSQAAVVVPLPASFVFLAAGLLGLARRKGRSA